MPPDYHYHPFRLHRNDRFIKFRKLLEKRGVVKIIDYKKNSSFKKVEFCGKTEFSAFLETLFFSLLMFIGFDDFDDKNVVFKFKGRTGIGININVGDISKDLIQNMIGGEKEQLRKKGEEFFNSLIALYLSSFHYFDLIFPNTYITDLDKNTHELDIFGSILSDNEKGRKYIMLETTTGAFNKLSKIEDDFEYSKISHSWHFKKSVFKKWAIEKLYGIEIGLVYVTLKNLGLEQDKFLKAIIEKSNGSISVVCMENLDDNTDGCFISSFSVGNMLFDELNEFLKKLQENVDKVLQNIRPYIA